MTLTTPIRGYFLIPRLILNWYIRGRWKYGSGKYRSDNVWNAVKTENSKILGVSVRTKRSRVVFERGSWTVTWWYTSRQCMDSNYQIITNTSVVSNNPPMCKTNTIFKAITNTLFQLEEYGQIERSNLRLSQYNLELVFLTTYSCIFHHCNFDRIVFSTPAFSVAPYILPAYKIWQLSL